MLWLVGSMKVEAYTVRKNSATGRKGNKKDSPKNQGNRRGGPNNGDGEHGPAAGDVDDKRSQGRGAEEK